MGIVVVIKKAIALFPLMRLFRLSLRAPVLSSPLSSAFPPLSSPFPPLSSPRSSLSSPRRRGPRGPINALWFKGFSTPKISSVILGPRLRGDDKEERGDDKEENVSCRSRGDQGRNVDKTPCAYATIEILRRLV